MSLPTADTIVTYPAGAVSGRGTVLHSETLPDGRAAVLLDATPAHPVDAGWPDQGPDRGTLNWDGDSVALEDCLVAATDGAALFLGPDVPVRKGTEGWAFVVAHVLATAPPVGAEVTVEVDAAHREALSLGHTGCHLASYALNRAMAARWSKQVPLDELGHPGFDALANATSLIREHGSVDTYRLGKSLRKRGFIVEGLPEALPGIEAELNAALAEWIGTDAPVRLERDGDRLTDRRTWLCELPGATLRLPCGGTHAESLGRLGALRASLTLAEAPGALELTMHTRTP